MTQRLTSRLVSIALTISIILSDVPAAMAGGSHEKSAAKQIVFVSGEQFLADGELDDHELDVLGDSVLIVPGGGVAYDGVRAKPLGGDEDPLAAKQVYEAQVEPGRNWAFEEEFDYAYWAAEAFIEANGESLPENGKLLFEKRIEFKLSFADDLVGR